MRGWLRLSVGAVLLIFVSGCSVKMMYNNADRLARWSASDYIDMDKPQREYFDREIESFMYWHRTTQLPEYAQTLTTLEAVTADGTDVEELQSLFDSMFGWWDAIEDRILPTTTEILLSLTDEQVARLPEKLSKDNEELAEDEAGLSLNEIQEHWWREYTDGFSRFSGRLSSKQKAHVAAEAVRYIPQMELWTDYRRRWQTDLLNLVRDGREDPDKFAADFASLTKRRKEYYGAELMAIFDQNEQLARDVGVWLINSFSDKQKARFSEQMLEFAAAFEELVAEAPIQPPPGGGCLVRCQ